MLDTAVKHLLFLTMLQIFWCQACEEDISHYPVSSNQYTGNEENEKAPEDIPHYPVSSGSYIEKEEKQKAPEEILHDAVSSSRYTVKEEI